jgi:hypothetical protein
MLPLHPTRRCVGVRSSWNLDLRFAGRPELAKPKRKTSSFDRAGSRAQVGVCFWPVALVRDQARKLSVGVATSPTEVRFRCTRRVPGVGQKQSPASDRFVTAQHRAPPTNLPVVPYTNSHHWLCEYKTHLRRPARPSARPPLRVCPFPVIAAHPASVLHGSVRRLHTRRCQDHPRCE